MALGRWWNFCGFFIPYNGRVIKIAMPWDAMINQSAHEKCWDSSLAQHMCFVGIICQHHYLLHHHDIRYKRVQQGNECEVSHGHWLLLFDIYQTPWRSWYSPKFLPGYGKMEGMFKREARSGGKAMASIIATSWWLCTSWTPAISLYPHQFLTPCVKRQSRCLLSYSSQHMEEID